MKKPEDDKDEKAANPGDLSRRQFGRAIAARVGGLAVGAAAAAQETPPAESPVKVSASPSRGKQLPIHSAVVVGAGLSGLIAARELCRAGWRVWLVEAEHRIGGRMYGRGTIEGGYLDLGGQWVGETQYEMQALVAELGISPFLSYERGRSVQRYNRNRTSFDGDVSGLLQGKCGPYALPEDPSKCNDGTLGACTPDPQEGAVWGELLKRSSTVIPDRPWATNDATNMDRRLFDQSLQKWAAELMPGRSPWLPTLQSRIGGSGGFEPSEVSELHMAWTQRVGPQSETPEKWLLCGGAGQIPEMLLEEMARGDRLKLYLGRQVRSIVQTSGGVRVNTNPSNNPTSDPYGFQASAVIVAIPPALRNKITFENVDPKVLEKIKDFSSGAPMGSMAKVHAVYETAFWRGNCLSGSSAGNLGPGADDLKYCQFVADSSPPGGKPGILTSFIAADTNKKLTAELARDYPSYSAEQLECVVKEKVLADFFRYFQDPRIKTDVKDFVYYNWDTKRFTGGAFTAYLKPGVWTTSAEVGWREPVGNIFWAGTETSDRWPGYFDGAIRAGKAAAARVLAKWSWPKPEDKEEACTASAPGKINDCRT